MTTNRSGWLSLCALALATACGNGIPPNQAVQQQLSLVAFNGCQDLEKYIQDTAVLDMRSTLEQQKQSGDYFRGVDGPTMATAGGADAAGPSAYTTTNTQVAGVDEADFVKNDGTRIFVLSGRTLYLNRSWPASSLSTVSRLPIEGWPSEMFLDESNHVVVFSQVETQVPGTQGSGASGLRPMPCGPSCNSWSSTLKTTVVDVSDLANPRVQSEFYQPGYYTSSRRVGSSVRLVMNDSVRWPGDVRWYPDSSPSLYNNPVLRGRAYDDLMARNEKAIRAQKLEDWLPKSYYKAADGSLAQVGYDCSEFHRTNAATRLGLVSVATMDLSPLTLATLGHPALQRTSIVAQAGNVYSSASSLYVTSSHWWWWPEPGQRDYTYVYKFDLLNPAGASYVAAGAVEGGVLDSFSLDEKDGYLRVATTLARRVKDSKQPWGRLEFSNRLSVLGTDGATLKVVGQSEEISPGERLYGSRFLGDKGFLVTFRQVDPLFTFDLSDPTHPRQVGQLEVPGFSTYLHPLDDTHLLAIGEYLPQDSHNWQERSIQLSIFDVSDLAHPRRTANQLVGNYSGWSPAMWDHHAFNYFPERHLLAIPFSDWQQSVGSDYWGGFVSELRVFSVDPVNGFTARGALTMKDVYVQENYKDWTWYWTPQIRRSVMADNYVYAIADGGIRVADVGSLSNPIATVLFDPYKP